MRWAKGTNDRSSEWAVTSNAAACSATVQTANRTAEPFASQCHKEIIQCRCLIMFTELELNISELREGLSSTAKMTGSTRGEQLTVEGHRL